MTIQALEPLPADLAAIQVEIEGYAREYGLDFFKTVFEMVSHDQLNEIASYGGFPTRYPHWRFGMQYEELSKSYAYGLSKIYEMVINNNPCYAYLMKSNHMTDQKLVMAHVYGHCDFFKNNSWFSCTSRKMMDEMANHGQRIVRHMERYGQDEVEAFIDNCLSIEDLIDIHSPFIQRFDVQNRYDFTPGSEEEHPEQAAKFKAKDYMDSFINPPAALAAENERLKKKAEQTPRQCPAEPTRDVMLFILEHAPLRPWQLDVMTTIRDEAYYFAPQAQTKIMNEGWASYWHSTIMTRQGLTPGEVIDYADHHSGTMATSGNRLNPYKLGIELFRDIEERWNKGRFGKDFNECDDWRERQEWDTKAGKGREKIFEVRKIHNDQTFIDEFLTPEFCHRHKMFSFGFNDDSETYEIESREFPKIKQRLLFNLTNLGRPQIEVRDGNYRNRGELLLRHTYNGVELRQDYARDTLSNLFKLWARPVHIETVVSNVHTTVSYDGVRHGEEKGRPYEGPN
jgi:stage V sporulation protein R